MSRHLLLIVACSLPAVAAGAHDREKFLAIGSDVASVLGAADYCGINAQPMFEAFSRGLKEFGLRPRDVQAVLTSTQERRQNARNGAAKTLSGHPCPAETRGKIQQSLQSLQTGWYQAVQAETGVDLRTSGATQTSPASPGAPQGQMAPRPSAPVNSRNPPSAQSTPTPGQSRLCTKGQAVSVLYAGQWHPAKVLEGPDSMGTCKVSYDGYGSNWDEWVSAQRMRPATQASRAQASQPPAQQATGQVSPGRYQCYTFDAGQLNYTYTDVVIHDASRYSVGNKSGAYSLAGNVLNFTGTLSNAVGKYAIKNTGKPQIDLIFNGDPRSSMACTKAR